MSRFRLALASLALLIGLGLVPAASAKAEERIGARINLFGGGFQVFPAGEPFYIEQGWGLDQSDPEVPQAFGRSDFSLSVDGVERKESFVDKFHAQHPVLGRIQWRLWVHNFPDGMTGTHTFTGHWVGPCEALVVSGFNPGPCDHPVEQVTSVAPLTITVVFHAVDEPRGREASGLAAAPAVARLG